MTTVGQLEKLERAIELEKCFRLQKKLAGLSRQYRNKRFRDLYNLTYWQPIVTLALKIVRSRKGSRTAGIDNQTKYTVNETKLGEQICHELKIGCIKPSKLRRIEIPKSNGKVRVISIPTYKDRVVLTIIKLILEPIYEPCFNYSSHGFRPNKSVHSAINEARIYAGTNSLYSWVLRTDVKGCFDEINHGILLQILEERIADGKLIQLIRKYLKAGLILHDYPQPDELGMDQGKKGCPQGSPLSPLIANIYLDKLDRYINNRLYMKQQEIEKDKKNLSQKVANKNRRRAYLGVKERAERKGPFKMIRYADDLIILTPAPKQRLMEYFEEVREFARSRLKIEFSTDKTEISHTTDGICFLGFKLKRIYRPDLNKKIILVTVDPNRKKRHRAKLRELLTGNHDRDVENLIIATNQRIRGWRNFYQKSVTNCRELSYIDRTAFWRIIKWLMKKFKAGKKKVFKAYYRTILNPETKNHIKCILAGKTRLERAVKAMTKLPIDFARTPVDPWTKKGTAQEMLDTSYPIVKMLATWNGTRKEYGENFAKMARKALARDKYTCCKCGVKYDLHVHHINKRKSFTNPKSAAANSLENLITLCSNCHKHANKMSAINCINWLLEG